jgi:hypothetical protein
LFRDPLMGCGGIPSLMRYRAGLLGSLSCVPLTFTAARYELFILCLAVMDLISLSPTHLPPRHVSYISITSPAKSPVVHRQCTVYKKIPKCKWFGLSSTRASYILTHLTDDTMHGNHVPTCIAWLHHAVASLAV